jgi:hypothetical protein
MSGTDTGAARPPDPDEVVTLAEAATISGVDRNTLAIQARLGRLLARKSSGTWLISRRNLHHYLIGRRYGNALPLPPTYVPPEGMGPEPDRATTTTTRGGDR